MLMFQSAYISNPYWYVRYYSYCCAAGTWYTTDDTRYQVHNSSSSSININSTMSTFCSISSNFSFGRTAVRMIPTTLVLIHAAVLPKIISFYTKNSCILSPETPWAQFSSSDIPGTGQINHRSPKHDLILYCTSFSAISLFLICTICMIWLVLSGGDLYDLAGVVEWEPCNV